MDNRDHDPELVAIQLKRICNSFIEGMNIRDFDPDSPRWAQTLAPQFRLLATSDAMYEHLADTASIGSDTTGTKDLDKHAMLSVLRKSAEENPGWRSRVVDMVVTVYKEEQASGKAFVKVTEGVDAEVWCSCEHSGVPEGVTRSAMWVGYFAPIGEQGRWMIVGARHVSGMGSLDFL